MTFQQVWAIDGATYSGPMLRMMQKAASRSADGVVDYGDLRVMALAVPGTSVRIRSGQAMVLGREGDWQGSYAAWNQGDHVLPVAANLTGSTRYDLVILRVEDPTWPGTEWDHDVATDPMVTPVIVQDVDSGATTLPPNTSGIVLARIRLDPMTSTIEQSDITDLRTMALPKSQLEIRVQKGVDPIDYAGNTVDPDWENWPNLVWSDVYIPPWATQVQVDAIWAQVGHFPDDKAGGGGSTDARGRVRVALGTGGTDIITGVSSYNFNEDSSNGQRVVLANFDQRPVPAALRGTVTNLRMQVSGEAGVRGRLRADGTANFRVLLNFREQPVVDVDA